MNCRPHQARRADKSRPPLSVERVRQRHAQLGHAVALQERVAGDLSPAFEWPHRKRGRPRHHQAHAAAAFAARALHRGRRRVPRLNQPVVDGRHGGEDGDVARRQAGPRGFGLELRQDLAARARGERAAEHVDDAVHVMERQDEQRAIGLGPFPGGDERRDLRRHVPVRRHHPLRFSRRPAGVDDHRPAIGREPDRRPGMLIGRD